MEACSSFFLPRLIGLSRALHLTTTGSVLPANHPLLLELFSEILPTPEDTMRRAFELADDIAKNTSLVSTKLMRDLMYRGPQSAEAAHLLDSRILHDLYGRKDNVEGVRSFFEKRTPDFQASMNTDAPDVWPWWVDIKVESKPSCTKL
jgi:enoyl-CoA hydratase/carnithine racemase